MSLTKNPGLETDFSMQLKIVCFFSLEIYGKALLWFKGRM